MALAEDEHVIEALAAYAAQKALAEGVGLRRSYRRFQHSRADGSGDAVEVAAVLVVAVTKDEARSDAERRRVRSWWATQVELGLNVTPTLTTLREPSSTMKNAKSGRNRRNQMS
jgi:hypothetical protein